MGMLNKKLLSIAAAGMLAASPAGAVVTFGGDGGAGLQGVMDSIADDGTSDINVVTDQMGFDDYWSLTAAGQASGTIIAELAGFANGNRFGIYDQYSTGTTVELFPGAAGPGGPSVGFSIFLDGSVVVNGADTGIDFSGDNFGFYLHAADGNMYYSDTSLNGDGVDHMAAYQGVGEATQLPNRFPGTWTPDEYVLAFEDLYNGGDRDFADFVVMIESIEIPAPATLALLGLGLIGMGFRARRKAA